MRSTSICVLVALTCASLLASGSHPAAQTTAPPKVIVISLDGATPSLVEAFLDSGVLDRRTGLGRLRSRGISADQNIPATPSVTAVSHIAIATGSTAVHNDITGNSIHPVAASINTSLSGFGAPIGGYQINPLGPSAFPTAEPLWVRIRNFGGSVVTATWPGADGVDVRVSGTVVQAASPARTVDYTVPFGAFGGLGAQGFTLTSASFVAAGGTLIGQLQDAGRSSFSQVMVTANPVERVFCAPIVLAFNPCFTDNLSGRTLEFAMKAAALDTTNDGQTNYDTLVFFAESLGIPPGPISLPSTGPAYARRGGPSALFFYEGSGNKVGSSFFISRLDPDLAVVRFARYAANFIPRNAPVLGAVDDINAHVGFWQPQPDFRIPERLSPGFTAFPDLELEAMYLDQVRTFTSYQLRVAQRAIARNPGADLIMIYFEQPDGSGHQFTLTDPRQATDPLDPRSIGGPGLPFGATGQDAAKIARYDSYLKFAYQTASDAVEAIINTVGVTADGEPLSDIFVVSDHGMAPFHTAVSLGNLLSASGVSLGGLNLRTTGPATNIYVNLAGREAGGSISPAAYQTLVANIASALENAVDPNPIFNPGGRKLFSHVWTRPMGCGQPGFCTDDNIGQDSGDIVALMAEGYNFDGTQAPVVARLGDTPAVTSVFSVPNFYGAHGHDSSLPSMSAILYAAGPSLKRGKKIPVVHGIDIAPTIFNLLNLAGPPTMDGSVIPKILKKDKD